MRNCGHENSWLNEWSDNMTQALRHANKARLVEETKTDEKCVELLNSLSAMYLDYSERVKEGNCDDLFERCSSLISSSRVAIASNNELQMIESVRLLEGFIEVILERPSQRLAAYGTLRPGQSNYKIVSNIQGEWTSGVIRGSVREVAGYPAYTWDESGEPIPVEVLISEQLISEYARIDEFEGANYKRTLVPVLMDDAYSVCNVYETSVAWPR